MIQKELFSVLFRDSHKQFDVANGNLAAALTMATNSAITFTYNSDDGLWSATGEIETGPGPKEIWYTTTGGEMYNFNQAYQYVGVSADKSNQCVSQTKDPATGVWKATFTSDVTYIGMDSANPNYVQPVLCMAAASLPRVNKVWLPNNVTIIGAYSLVETDLATFKIPESVTKIEMFSLYGSGELRELNIPKNVTTINNEDGDYPTLGYFPVLTSLTVDPLNTKYTDGNGCNVVMDKTTGKIIAGANTSVIPAGATGIDQYAFVGAAGLKSIDIPSSVTNIGLSAFMYCSGLTTVTLHEGLKNIRTNVFQGCSALTSLTIPNSIITLGSNICLDCTNLRDVTIGSGADIIGNASFKNCMSLTGVTILADVDMIGTQAFYNTPALTAITYNNTKAAWADINLGDNWMANSGLVVVHCTDGDVSLVGVAANEIWYDTVEDNQPFDLTGYTNDVIAYYGPDMETVPTVGFELTGHTYSNKHGVLKFSAPVTKLGVVTEGSNSVIYPSFGRILKHSGPAPEVTIKSLAFPSGITAIGFNALSLLSSYEGVIDIPKQVTDLSSGAIMDTTASGITWNNLTGLTEQATVIGNYCIPEINIPTSITTIGNLTFMDWNSATSITIPNTVTQIGTEAFFNTYVTRANFHNNTSYAESYLKVNIIGENNLVEDHGLIINTSNNYPVVKVCRGNVRNLYIPSYVEGLNNLIGENTKRNRFESIVVDTGNTYFTSMDGSNAIVETATGKLILGCSNGTIKPGVKLIGPKAFNNCFELKTVNIPSTVTGLSLSSFGCCENLTAVTIEPGLLAITNSAFYGCSKLKGVELPNTLLSFGDYTFDYCSEMTGLTVPASVTAITHNPFTHCPNVTTINVDPGNSTYHSVDGSNTIVKTNGQVLTVGCKTSVIPNNVLALEDYSFDYVTELSSITIPTSVTSFGYGVFRGCSKLQSITYPGNQAAWNAIYKKADVGTNSSWHYGCPQTIVHCTDGDITIAAEPFGN